MINFNDLPNDIKHKIFMINRKQCIDKYKKKFNMVIDEINELNDILKYVFGGLFNLKEHLFFCRLKKNNVLENIYFLEDY